MNKIIALLGLIMVIMLGSVHGQLKEQSERMDEIQHELLIDSFSDLNGKRAYQQNDENIKFLKEILKDGR